MRELTFSGFLKRYLQDLSGLNGENLRLLAEKADSDNPRLKEPLILYAYFAKEETTAKRQFANSSLYEELCVFLKKHKNKEEAIKYLRKKTQIDNYQRVYKSYISKRDKYKSELALKKDIREEILLELKNKGISTYSVAMEKKLNLNKTNFYSFLRGKMDCITLSSAYNILKYLKEIKN